MSDQYRIFGAELSPYSVKVRSYFRYKGIPHEWIVRNVHNQAEFDRYAKLPLIPLVIAPDGTAMQDSTPIIERMEAAHPGAVDPSARSGRRLRLGAHRGVRRRVGQQADVPLSLVLRGGPGVGGPSASRRRMNPDAHRRDGGGHPRRGEGAYGAAPRVRRLVGRHQGPDRGVVPAPARHPRAPLDGRPFLFGGRPAFGDFGLYAQLYELSIGSDAGRHHARACPAHAGVDRTHARPEGERRLGGVVGARATLLPLLRDEIAAVFLPWSLANAEALAAGEKEFTVDDRRQALQPGDAEVPRQVARRAAPALRGGARPGGAGRVARSRGVPAVSPVLREKHADRIAGDRDRIGCSARRSRGGSACGRCRRVRAPLGGRARRALRPPAVALSLFRERRILGGR